MRRQGLLELTGVVLKREISPEGNIRLLVLLRKEGLTWISLPGAARGKVRFGGSIEPLVWGEFNLYRGQKRIFLKEISVKRDFWDLRKSFESLKTALQWSRIISSSALSGLPVDEVLPVFYWSLDLLEKGLNRDLLSLRFLWRLLRSWGVAPSLSRCSSCGAPIEKAYWEDGAFLCSQCKGQSSKVVRDLALANWVVLSKKEELLIRKENLTENNNLRNISHYLMKNIDLLK